MASTKNSKTSALKLLMITGTWPPMHCGVGDYTSMLCDHLSRMAFNVHVLTSRQSRPDLHIEGNHLLEVHPRMETWNFSSLGVVKSAVREIKPDLINIQWPTAAYGRSLAISLLPAYLRFIAPQTPLVTTLHELRYFSTLTRLRAWPFLAFSRRVIIVDPLDLDFAKRLYAPAASRCRHVPIGSNLPPLSLGYNRAERRRQLGFSETDFVVGFFGFANPPKGLETLLAALRRLKEILPQIKFLLLSQLSEQNSYQRRLQHDLKMTSLDRITVNPEYAEPRLAGEYLAAADCAVLPFLDGVSVKRGSLMACLAQGLPIITTTPGDGEITEFQDGVNLLLVPPRDPQKLSDSIRRLVEDPDLRARLSLGAWDLARLFAWEDIAGRQIQVFEEALRENVA